LTARVDELERSEMSSTAMTISRLKTGELTGLATWIGAIVGGADRTKLRALTRFGKNIGICLQMHNDIDEVERYVNGSERCDDLRNARVTWPWAWASRLLSANRFEDLQRRYGRTIRNHHGMRGIAAELLEIVSQHGQTTISKRLDQQSRLLAEHIEVLELIDKMTVALAPLKRTIPTRVSDANVN
jgi:geranylgeranyl pyrophosphate synthase